LCELPVRGLVKRRRFGIRGSTLKASIRNAAQVVGGVGTDRAALHGQTPTAEHRLIDGVEIFTALKELELYYDPTTPTVPLDHAITLMRAQMAAQNVSESGHLAVGIRAQNPTFKDLAETWGGKFITANERTNP
jgi:hypothetical protein